MARTNGLVVQEVPDEVLIYDLESSRAHCLNQTAAMVWKACDGKTSVSDIARVIGTQTGNTVSDDLVWLAIDQLNDISLMESQVASQFAGKSRREALKKIGMASMIALPIIASLAAPKSVMALTSCSCQTVGDNPSLDCQAQPSCPQDTCGAGNICVVG